MKYLKLRVDAYVNGALRYTGDGVQQVDDDEAQRLIDAGLAEDVSADFAEADAKPAKKAG